MSNDNPSRRILGPFNRVEGDLEVSVEIDNDHISKAWVNSPLFRGFEQILNNKDPRDALVYTPRICGICSVSQSVAAAQALAQAQQLSIAPNGQIATNIILAAENMADHLSHFYLFFMPDFARQCYAKQPWFDAIESRFKAQKGSAAKQALPARAQFLHITGILAGKWPHSLAIQPGGTTRAIETHEKISLLNIVKSFRYFLEETLFGDTLENVAALDSEISLNNWKENHSQSDFAQFLHVADSLKLNSVGRAYDNFMSYGAYPSNDAHLFQSGIWVSNGSQANATLNPDNITEDISHSWLQNKGRPQHPYQGSTLADADENSGYSWCKAPRLNEQVIEVGAIARQTIAGHSLIKSLVESQGGNVKSRIVARMLELALVVPEMEKWCQALTINDPFCHHSAIPEQAQGAGLVEAARGSLGHWLKIEDGRIQNYQIIAPTTWNFSPRDHQDQPGALEMALQNTFIESDAIGSATIQHIIRSFDPCMVCTVH